MKKLKLNLANMPDAQVLTREQLKTITGGENGSGESGSDKGCSVTCSPGHFACCNSGMFFNVIEPKCTCIADTKENKDTLCENGGRGTISCSVS